MSKQLGSTNIDDLDDLNDTRDIIDELDDLIDEDDESDTETVKIIPVDKVKGSIFSNKLKKISSDALIILVLLLALGNKYTMHYIFKIPFLASFEGNSWVPISILSFLVCMFYFITKLVVV
jgi:hypothetical protein